MVSDIYVFVPRIPVRIYSKARGGQPTNLTAGLRKTGCRHLSTRARLCVNVTTNLAATLCSSHTSRRSRHTWFNCPAFAVKNSRIHIFHFLSFHWLLPACLGCEAETERAFISGNRCVGMRLHQPFYSGRPRTLHAAPARCYVRDASDHRFSWPTRPVLVPKPAENGRNVHAAFSAARCEEMPQVMMRDAICSDLLQARFKAF